MKTLQSERISANKEGESEAQWRNECKTKSAPEQTSPHPRNRYFRSGGG